MLDHESIVIFTDKGADPLIYEGGGGGCPEVFEADFHVGDLFKCETVNSREFFGFKLGL